MTNLKRLSVFAIIVFLTLGGLLIRTSGDLKAVTERVRELEDRVALNELVGRYAVLVDQRKISELTLLFTEDAIVETWFNGVQTSSLQGRAQLEQAAIRFEKTYEIVGHNNGQFLIDLNGDRAQGTLYTNVHLIPQGSAKRSNLHYGITYIDQYERHNGKWLIARRKASYDFQTELLSK